MMKHVLIVAFAVLLASGAPGSYYDSVREWQRQREAGLRSPDSWLTLVGLEWLKPGDNAIEGFGNLHLIGTEAVFTPLSGKVERVNNKPLTSPVRLGYNEENPDVVQMGTRSFYVIQRADRLGVRIKDSASPNLKNFHGMQYFPVNPALHFPEARLIPDPKKIPILNVVGQTDLEESPGVVEFLYQGKSYRLRPIYEDKTLFFLFKDPTNRTETYQPGRMLNTPLPVQGRVDLDFNRSYNPPCTFTPFSTCPLPPKENHLPFPVTAGEKRYGQGHVELPVISDPAN